MIVPPKELRGLIDKTADYVAKNGVKFEEQIYNKQNEENFSFLRLDNPYRAYYDKRVIFFAKQRINNEQKNAEMILEEKEEEDELSQTEDNGFSFGLIQPKMSVEMRETIQMTARYVAVSGEDFLGQLMLSEENNPQFSFLKPNSPFFSYFTDLISSYVEIMENREKHNEALLSYVESLDNVIKECEGRIQHKHKQENYIANIMKTDNKEVKYEYDWNNFTIMETIDFEEKRNRRDRTEEFRARNKEVDIALDGVLKKRKIKDRETVGRAAVDDREYRENQQYVDGTMVKCTFCNTNISSHLFEQHRKEELELRRQVQKTTVSEKELSKDAFVNNLNSFVNLRKKRMGEEDDESGFEHKVIEKPAFLKRHKGEDK